MNNKLAIYGCGGHSNVIIDIAKRNGFKNIKIFDDNIDLPNVTGNLEILIESKDEFNYYFVAIGNNHIRKNIYLKLKKLNLVPISLIHPNSNIASNVKIENGVCIMAGATINAKTIIYEGSIINTNSSVDHDCRIGKFSHICPGVNIAGTVNVGELVFIGIGSNIVNNINISSDSMIKAGTTVVKSI